MTTKKRYSKFSAIKPQGNIKWVINMEGIVTRNSNLEIKDISTDQQDRKAVEFYINLENVDNSVSYVLSQLEVNEKAVYNNKDNDNSYTTIKCIGYNRVAERLNSIVKPGSLIQINGVANVSKWESNGEQYNQLIITVYDFWVRRFVKDNINNE